LKENSWANVLLNVQFVPDKADAYADDVYNWDKLNDGVSRDADRWCNLKKLHLPWAPTSLLNQRTNWMVGMSFGSTDLEVTTYEIA